VEIVRAMMEAFVGPRPERALKLLDASVRFDLRGRPDGKVWVGRDGVRRAMIEWIAAWEEYAMQVERYVDAGERVVVFWHERGRGKASGLSMEQDGTSVVTVCDGQVVHLQNYQTRAEALKAVGLEESAVSKENVETARRAYAAATTLSDPDVFAEYFHSDAEMVPPRIYPDTEPSYIGLEGFKRFQRQLDEIWDDWRFEAERFLDARDRVVVFARISGTGKQSRAAVVISTAHLLTWRAGRIARFEIFLDRREALKAVGLQE
jgi:ketosteroid isomerase-like protein